MSSYTFPNNLYRLEEINSGRWTVSNLIKLKTTIIIVIWGIALALIYVFIVDGTDELFPIFNAVIVGLIAGLVTSYFELSLFRKVNRRLNFSSTIIVRTILYLILFIGLIISVTLISRSVRFETGLLETFFSIDYQAYLRKGDFIYAVFYAMVLSFAANFVIMVSRKLGPGILWNHITGKYHKPEIEERIFMFLDINQSTAIAEKLGHLQFHRLLADFFYDISDSIRATHGSIYQYVGDEIVVSWDLKTGLRNGNCIRTYFYAYDIIENMKSKYLHKYGLVPTFKAAFHCGEVTVGEVGRIKTEIVYNGDVVNTTAMMEKECSNYGKRILLSKELLDQLPQLPEFEKQNIGTIMLKGKMKSIDIYSLDAIKRKIYYITPNKLIVSANAESVSLN